MGGHLVRGHSHGVHGGHLHGDLARYVVVDRLVEGYNRRELVARVDVGDGGGALDGLVVSELHLLAGHTDAVRDVVLYRAASLQRGCEKGLFRGGFAGHGGVQDVLRQRHKVSILGYEVGFAFQGHDGGESALVSCEHAAFGGLAVGAFGGHGLTLLANDLHCLFKVVVGFFQSLFAIHHPGSAHLAEVGDICHCYCHIAMILLCLVYVDSLFL